MLLMIHKKSILMPWPFHFGDLEGTGIKLSYGVMYTAQRRKIYESIITIFNNDIINILSY